MLTRRGVEVPRDDAAAMRKVRRDLVVSPVSFDDFPKRFNVFLELPDRVIVPQFWARDNLGVQDTRGPSVPMRSTTFLGNLRKELSQPEAAAAAEKSLRDTGGALLALPTGYGKTVTAVYVACRLGLKTVVVVGKEFLADQWEARIRAHCPDAKITHVRGPTCDVSGDFVIAMLQTLAKRRFSVDNPSVFDDVGLVCVDECFPYRQFIATERGAMEIGAVYNSWRSGETIRVHSFDEHERKFVLRPVTHAWQKHAERLVEVAYSKSNFKCTPRHRVLTIDGWREAGELAVGDLLVGRYDDALQELSVARAMNADQYQVFLGSLLGDGHLATTSSGRHRLQVTHGNCQRAYCEWKASMFGVEVREFVGGYKNETEVCFATRLIDLPRSKPWSKSTCPQWVLDEIDERALAVWYMDDGSLSSCGGITLSTHSFDEDTHVRVCAKLDSMGFPAVYRRETKADGRSFFVTRLNQEGGVKFLCRIAKYVHETMRYKLAVRSTLFDQVDSREDGRLYELGKVRYQWRDACTKCGKRGFHRRRANNIKDIFYCPKMYQVVDLPSVDQSYLWNSAYLDYGTIRVASIRDIVPKDKRVYDIQVDGTHTFVCCSIGSVGPVVHNCHHVGAEKLTMGLVGLAAPYVLGLSATPTRKDGLTRVIHWYVGPTAFAVDRKDQTQVTVHVEKFDHPRFREPPPMNRRGDVCYASLVSVLVDIPERTVLIADHAESLSREGRRVLVLSHRRGHAKDIATELVRRGVDAATYLGGDKIAPDAMVTCATFALVSEGYDDARLSALVLATPASDVIQACGRVMRGGGGDDPVIVDVADQFCVCHAQLAKRRRYYKAAGFAMADSTGPALGDDACLDACLF